jgi:hypothetical protein
MLWLLVCWLLTAKTGWGQPVPAPADVAYRSGLTEAQLRYYLSRALTLQGLVGIPASARQPLLRWAGQLGTRFAGRVGGFWLTPGSDAAEQAWQDTTRHTVARLRVYQPDIVVQGAVFEIVYPGVNNLTVPNRIRAEFGEDTLQPVQRHFRLVDMMYPAYFAEDDPAHYRLENRPPGQAAGVPDMSRPETQMWFYFCACRQLDAGCEALHFGQVRIMDDRDPGHHAWWNMLARVRRYAHARNRGFVLCDAHTHGEFYDPDPAHPLPDSLRQLLFDFHATPMRPTEVDTLRQGTHCARLDYAAWVQPDVALYGLSAGGRTPTGWYCHHLPGLVEFDNFGSAVLNKPNQPPFVWGMDEISWFASQPQAYRSEWLVYAAARVRQLDPEVYLEMPGLRVVSVPGQLPRDYRADLDSQGATIQGIWDGSTAAQAGRLLLIGPAAPTGTPPGLDVDSTK